jgi:hypothetical protein
LENKYRLFLMKLIIVLINSKILTLLLK